MNKKLILQKVTILVFGFVAGGQFISAVADKYQSGYFYAALTLVIGLFFVFSQIKKK